MILIDYKKLTLGILIGSTVAVGMSSPAIGLTQHAYEIACYEPVQRGACIRVIAQNGKVAQLSTRDLKKLESRSLTYVANRLLLPSRGESGVSSEPFILPTKSLDPLRALLLKFDLRNITYDLAHDAVRLADYLCLHDPKVLSEIYNRPEEGQLYCFLKGLAGSNMPVLAEYYERLLDAGQREGAQELEQFILPYTPYGLSSRGRLGEVRNEDPARGHTDLVSSVALSPDGNTLVSGSYDHTIIIWRKDAAGRWQLGQRLGEVGNEDPACGHIDWVRSVVVSADGNMLVSGSDDRKIIIWRKDAAGGWQMGQWLGEVDNDDPVQGHTSNVYSVVVSADGNTLVSGSGDRTVIVWRKDAAGRWQLGQRLGEVGNDDPVRGHTDWVRSVVVSADGNTLVSGSDDRRIIIWRKDAAGRWQLGQRLGAVFNNDPARGHTGYVYSVVVSADGNTLVSGSGDHTVIVWRKDAAGRWQLGQRLGEVGNRNPAHGHTSFVHSVVVSADGNTLASGSYDRTIIIWRKDTVIGQWQMGQRLSEIYNRDSARGHTDAVCSVAVSADGNTLVSGSDDRRIMIWRKDVLAYCRSMYAQASASMP